MFRAATLSSGSTALQYSSSSSQTSAPLSGPRLNAEPGQRGAPVVKS